MAAPQYGFWLGDLEIKPYLSRNELLEDTQSGLLPHFRRPGSHKGYHIVFRDDVEPYYRRKGIPDSVIAAKMKELRIGKVAARQA